MSPECRDGLHAIRLGLRDDAGEKAMAWALGEGAHIGGAPTRTALRTPGRRPIARAGIVKTHTPSLSGLPPCGEAAHDG